MILPLLLYFEPSLIFLINSIVGNSLTFALGPKLLDGDHSHEPSEEHRKEGEGHLPSSQQVGEQGHDQHSEEIHASNSDSNHQNGHTEEANEQTSLLPEPVVRRGEQVKHSVFSKGKRQWESLSPWAKTTLDFCYAFLNPPLIGAVIGAIFGLTPPLHKVFFNDPQAGGIFKAWLTDSVGNIGSLFATLQVVVVGVKLSSSLRKMKRGEEGGRVPWVITTLVLFVRFILWPA